MSAATVPRNEQVDGPPRCHASLYNHSTEFGYLILRVPTVIEVLQNYPPPSAGHMEDPITQKPAKTQRSI
jgi:hypothetical protein